MSAAEADIPLKISYTDKDVANAAKRDRWATGTYRGVLADITRQISKDNGHLMFKAVYRILRDPNDAGSIFGPGAYYWQCLPFRNPNRDGHTPKKFFARSTNDWLAAHVDDIPALPKKVDGQLVFKGDVIEGSDEEEAKKEAYDASYAKAAEMWEDESNESLEALKGTAVYFDVTYGEGSDFPSLGNFRQELEEGAELVDPATALEGASDEEEVEEAPVKAAKTTAKKPPLKAVNGGKKKK